MSLKLLLQYQNYADVFSEEKINVLLEHTEYDHRIDLVLGSHMPKNDIYLFIFRALQVLKEYLTEMEQTGKIQRSSSRIGTPIMFVPKPDGRL